MASHSAATTRTCAGATRGSNINTESSHSRAESCRPFAASSRPKATTPEPCSAAVDEVSRFSAQAMVEGQGFSCCASAQAAMSVGPPGLSRRHSTRDRYEVA